MDVWAITEAGSDEDPRLFTTLELAEAYARLTPGEWGPLTDTCGCGDPGCSLESFHIDGVSEMLGEPRGIRFYITRLPVLDSISVYA